MCYCDRSLDYQKCCGAFIEQNQLPSTPLALMRSRYSAFVLHNNAYLQATAHGEALRQWYEAKKPNWLTYTRLEIIDYSQAGLNTLKGFVEFKAYFQDQGRVDCLHEKSLFKKIEGRWYYVSGKCKSV